MMVQRPKPATTSEPATASSATSTGSSPVETVGAVGRQEEDAAEVARRAQVWQPLLGPGWFAALEAELRRPSFENTMKEVALARARHPSAVFPPEDQVFRAFIATPLEKVRVVIVGQDPYHGRGQAMGLSFSVPRGVRVPPSLMNMLKEAGTWPSPHGDLTSWTQQGVFLLNTLLTVVEGKPLSHKSLGWERITDAAIRAVSRESKGVIFLLWGKEAQAKSKLVDTSRHKVLSAGHPSPLSYEKYFKGCGHFTKTNEILAERGEPQIDWRLPG